MKLEELRKEKNLTQKECAEFLGVPLRTYIRYERDEGKRSTIKYKYMLDKLTEYGVIDETHGVLELEEIKKVCKSVLDSFPIEYCYLFGSYAKRQASESSDIDLLVSTSVSGLKFYELVEELRANLKKKVDVLNVKQLENNARLADEILREGIKIYG